MLFSCCCGISWVSKDAKCINRLLIASTNVSVRVPSKVKSLCCWTQCYTPETMKDFYFNLNLICGLARQGCWDVKYEVLNELRTKQMSQIILCDNPHPIFHIKRTI